MRGHTTTVRAPQDAKIERKLHKVIRRNATDEELAQALTTAPGTRFRIDRDTYRVCEVYRDSLKRLIAVGLLEEERSTTYGEQATSAPRRA